MQTQMLNYKNHVFAECGVREVRFGPALGHARVTVSLQLPLHANYATIQPNERPWELRLGGHLALDHAQHHVADLNASTLLWPSHNMPRAPFHDLFGTVTFRTLEQIHDRRPPGDAPLKFVALLTISALGSFGSDSAGSSQLPFDMPLSEWRNQLGACGHSTFHTVEVPVGGARLAPALGDAAASLSKALDHRAGGRWNDAVAACREVVEKLDKVITDGGPTLKLDDKQIREAMTVSDRLRMVRYMVRHATHGAHHSISYTRDEAIYLVDLVSIVLKHYNGKLA